jgi:hypothetical protein
LTIAAHNSRLLSYDNLSRMPEWLPDALCRMSTRLDPHAHAVQE